MNARSGAPAAAVLAGSEQEFARTGHENAGFLSAAHGLMPREPPRLELPASHRAWDEVAARLPELWGVGAVRRELAGLPVLPAAPGELADEDLWRASTLLAIFAHAYVHTDPGADATLPASVAEPWRTVSERLGRPLPHLSYNDLILTNWRVREPAAADPLRVENLDLLVPAVGVEEERVFYLTQVEIAAQCTPLVGAAVRAQEAVLRDDRRALEEELAGFVERLRHVTDVSFMKIDPNPLGATHVDPVVWANVVAPFAVPIEPGVAGPSGTASPVFHLLDAVFGRRHFRTYLGEEVAHLRPWFPRHVQAFIEALEQISIRRFVERSGDTRLGGAFASALEAYAGEHGFLAAHRRKVYGYLEVAFKVGRQVTITGFTGAFEDRTWKEIDTELERARGERLEDVPVAPQVATLADRRPATADPAGDIHHIVLDVADAGLRCEPGDRCAVWVRNGPEAVDRTVQALRATGDEPIPMTATWREALAARGMPDAEALPLRQFLGVAKLRPLLRPVGKALLALTASERLDHVLEAYEEDQWELWDALELVAADGYDPARLWRARIWQGDALSRVVPPEPPRTYSIARAYDPAGGLFPTRLELTVGQLVYRARRGASEPVIRHGTASTYLTALLEADGGAEVPLRVVHPLRFHLPRDPGRPVVLFAGGTGIAPFLGFLHERARDPVAGPAWLFLAVRTVGGLPHGDELEALARRGHVDVRVAVSGEDRSMTFDTATGRFTISAAPRQRITDLVRDPAAASLLWELLRSPDEGGRGAVFYACGRASFAHAVLEALTDVVGQHLEPRGPGGARQAAEQYLHAAFAEGRVMQDTFMTFAPATAPGVLGAGTYDASEVALHNDEAHGYWLVVNGAVYDVTKLRHVHPGGPRIIGEYAGTDATREWEAVGHDRSSEVDALLSMYKIGAIRRLDLGAGWGVALRPSGLEHVALRDLFRRWVRFLYLAVEMENAFRNDLGYLSRDLVRGDNPSEPTPLRMQLVANTHMRFLRTYLDGLLRSAELDWLWAATIGLSAPDEDVRRLGRSVDALYSSGPASAVEAHAEQMLTYHRLLAERSDADNRSAIRALFSVVRSTDAAFLAGAKRVLRRGVQAFEQHEARTVDVAGEALRAGLLELPEIGAAYHAAFLDGVEGLTAHLPSAPHGGRRPRPEG